MNGPVEKKVTVAGIIAFIVSLIMGYLIKTWPALTPLADSVEALILAAVTALATYGAAWWTKHTARNDAGTRKTNTSDPIPPTD